MCCVRVSPACSQSVFTERDRHCIDTSCKQQPHNKTHRYSFRVNKKNSFHINQLLVIRYVIALQSRPKRSVKHASLQGLSLVRQNRPAVLMGRRIRQGEQEGVGSAGRGSAMSVSSLSPASLCTVYTCTVGLRRPAVRIQPSS